MLSKTDYMLFLRHPAWLWIKKYQKDILPPVDASTQAAFDRGHRIEQYAEARFPEGTQLGFTNFQEYTSLVERTREAIHKGKTTLFQPRFETESLTCICDVVVFGTARTLKLYEIKASTKVKDEHLYDLAFQAHVLQALGYDVESISVLHINRDYIRNGEIDSQELFTEADVTEPVRELSEKTLQYIEKAGEVLERRSMPDPSPRHCRLHSFQDWLPIYEKLRPISETDAPRFPSLTAPQVAELEAHGATSLETVPLLESFTDKQKAFWHTLHEGDSLDTNGVEEFLNTLSYPLYFLDYETASDALPLFDGTRPYQQICFQYSLHVIREKGAELEHFEYLHTNKDNPIEPLSESLRLHIGDTGSVVVWYKDFESSRNSEMAVCSPEFAEFYASVNERMVDLMIPFSTGLVRKAACMGSSSIKKVLPVLVPDLRYEGMNISEGETAQRRWMDVFLFGSGGDVEALQRDLLEYCKLDTLAMVRIWEWLSKEIA